MPVDLNRLLGTLNNSKLLKENNALYQVIKGLIVSAQELTQLIADSGGTIDAALNKILVYGTHAERLSFAGETIAGVLILFFETDTNQLWGFTTDWVIIADIDASYATVTDETPTLVNSRMLVAQTGIAFDTTTPGQIGISSTAAFGQGITTLTGDVLAGPAAGTTAATLSTTGVSAGTYGSSTLSAVITVDAKGRLTAATNATITGSTTSIGNLLDFTFVNKAADQAVVSSTVLVDDTHLIFSVGSTQRWTAQLTLFAVGDTAGDMKFTFSVPTGATAWMSGLRLATDTTGPTGLVGMSATNDLTTVRNAGLVGSTIPVMIQAVINVLTASTSGTITFRWAQLTSSTVGTTILANSYLEAKRFS